LRNGAIFRRPKLKASGQKAGKYQRRIYRIQGGEDIKRRMMKMNRVKLSIEDIEPLEKAIAKYASMWSGLVWYKGEGWDWRMARYALEDLKARRDEYKE